MPGIYSHSSLGHTCDQDETIAELHSAAEIEHDQITVMSSPVSTAPGPHDATVLAFVNNGTAPVAVVWVDYEGEEQHWANVATAQRFSQRTFATHFWRVKGGALGAANTLVQYVGSTATITVNADGSTCVQAGLQPPLPAGPLPHPTDPSVGLFRRRGEAQGIGVYAFDCVHEPAVRIAEHIVRSMLEGTPPGVTARLVEAGASVAIIGRYQVTTDIPAHAHLKGVACSDGRCYDAGTRGLGGTIAIPVTSVGEENLTMVDDSKYGQENILVHEFAHAVMDVGLAGCPEREQIERAYEHALEAGLYDPDSYIASNSDEYWAEATQAWFEATVRVDVTSGVTTRRAVRRKDPQLAAVLAAVWGDGRWRFPHTAPAEFEGASSAAGEDVEASGLPA